MAQVDGKNPAISLLDNAAALNISVLRVFATGVEPELPLQVKEGESSEERGAVAEGGQCRVRGEGGA